MELFEILNENGSGSGRFKSRSDVHRDGDLHGSVHIWVIRNLKPGGHFEVLLQQRSMDKDAYPGCWDTSCAGHIDAGETYFIAAVRELSEELGIKAQDSDLKYMFDHAVSWEAEFHGEKFINNEISKVYSLICDMPAERFAFQKEEIAALCWMDAQELLNALKSGDSRYCIQLSLFEKLIRAVASMRHFTIHITDFASAPDAGSYAGSDEWTYHETYEFFGTEAGAIERAHQYVKEFREEVSPYLASVTYWLT